MYASVCVSRHFFSGFSWVFQVFSVVIPSCITSSALPFHTLLHLALLNPVCKHTTFSLFSHPLMGIWFWKTIKKTDISQNVNLKKLGISSVNIKETGFYLSIENPKFLQKLWQTGKRSLLEPPTSNRALMIHWFCSTGMCTIPIMARNVT